MGSRLNERAHPAANPNERVDGMLTVESNNASSDADEFSPGEDLSARLGRWLVQTIVVGLIVIMGAEMLFRSAFGWSIQISNEVGGYALLAITFLSMASGQL